MQFLVLAHDGTDSEAPERRLRTRQAHLAAVARLQRSGQFIIGGAILNAQGSMIGSAVIFDFPDRAALDRYLATDPYVSEHVWQQIEIQPFRVAQLPQPAAS